MKALDNIIEEHRRDTDHFADQEFDEDNIKGIVNEYCTELESEKKALIEGIKLVRDMHTCKDGTLTGVLYDELTELIK